jgi:cell division GTPase FtsZ
VGIGETGASALDYFGKVADDIFPDRLIISDKDANSQNPFALLATISHFVIGTSWLFVIMDVEDLGLAKKVAKIVESSKNLSSAPSYDEFKLPLVTFLILCPTAADVRLADIPAEFGTWIILPEDKIAETGLTKNEAIYRAVNMMTSTASLTKAWGSIIDWDFAELPRTIGNFGRACIGFGTSLDAENNSIQAVKNALQSPLFIEDIGKAKKGLLVFSGGGDFLSMLEANEASTFLEELMYPEDGWRLLLQVDVDETATDGVTAFIFATNF